MAKQLGKFGQMRLTGDKAVRRTLDAMPKAMRKKGLRAALNAASRVVVRDIKRNLPKETGLLRVAFAHRVWQRGETGVSVIGARTSFASKKRAVLTGAKANRRPSLYLHLIELGVAPHIVKIERKKALAWRDDTGLQFATVVQHPGLPARRPVARALNTTVGAQRKAMAESIKKTILKSIRRGLG